MGPKVFKLQNFGVVLPCGGSGQSQRSSKCMSICMCTSVIGHSEFWEYIGGVTWRGRCDVARDGQRVRDWSTLEEVDVHMHVHCRD
jgi:hypothetical protein